jgi:hypothetical protein
MKINLLPIIIYSLSLLLTSFLLFLLWNTLIPKIFGLPVIDYVEAIGLYLLSSILFKSESSKLNTTEENGKI